MERLGLAGTEEEKTVEYIGDGVYASFDGYHIWLRTLDGMAIALEPNVYNHLIDYVDGLTKKFNNDN